MDKASSSSKQGFNPNRLTYDQGIQRIKQAVDAVGLASDSIVTSRDKSAIELKEKLNTTNVPNGFNKWQLPVYFDGPTQLFISVGEASAKVPSHSHDENGMRFIVSGSIIYEGQELTAGDWMWIPAKNPYSFEVGDFGAVMAYCYQCCCA